jgi:gliding motility-associated-like protein
MREVRIQNDVILYAPNTFTPDNDNLNNEWRVHISGVDIFNFNLTIFNRWGELIWESNDPDASWDGTYGGKLVETGTYVWTIRAEDAENDNNYEFNGFVNVIK